MKNEISKSSDVRNGDGGNPSVLGRKGYNSEDTSKLKEHYKKELTKEGWHSPNCGWKEVAEEFGWRSPEDWQKTKQKLKDNIKFLYKGEEDIIRIVCEEIDEVFE